MTLKVYTNDGHLIASTKDECIAACIVSTFGENGGWVSEDNKSHILWVEGKDGEAIASYDAFSDFIHKVRGYLPTTLPVYNHIAEKYSRYFYAYREARDLAHNAK